VFFPAREVPEFFNKTSMLHKTAGIVLRSVKYRDTSLIVTIYTAALGMQSYLASGANSGKKGSIGGARFQPGAILDLVVYQNTQKKLQRLKEAHWGHIYEKMGESVVRNCASLYVCELFYRSVRQPEPHAALFNFLQSNLLLLDQAPLSVAANLPLYVTIQLPRFLGFGINTAGAGDCSTLDLQEGCFVDLLPVHANCISGLLAEITRRLLVIEDPFLLSELALEKKMRTELYGHYLAYYRMHLPDFGMMRSLEVLQTVF
jgi:DNA repair protein RecO (recombination protein O)